MVDEAERFTKRASLDSGQVAIEIIVSDGHYLRGFIKQGPLVDAPR